MTEKLVTELEKALCDNLRLRSALKECEAYFGERADAEYFPDRASPVGNEEMRLLAEVREALAAHRSMSDRLAGCEVEPFTDLDKPASE